jgi:hypothetical protein
MNDITQDLLEELIKILEDPTSLRKDKRFKLLEKAYLERNAFKYKERLR